MQTTPDRFEAEEIAGAECTADAAALTTKRTEQEIRTYGRKLTPEERYRAALVAEYDEDAEYEQDPDEYYDYVRDMEDGI